MLSIKEQFLIKNLCSNIEFNVIFNGCKENFMKSGRKNLLIKAFLSLGLLVGIFAAVQTNPSMPVACYEAGPSKFSNPLNELDKQFSYSDYFQDVTPNTAYAINRNKLTIGGDEVVATPDLGYKFDCLKIADNKVTGSGTITGGTTFKAPSSKVTIKDILPDDFPVSYIGFPENSWTNENGVLLVNFSNIRLYLHDEDEVDYIFPNDLDSALTPDGNNYSLICDDGTETTFVMESGKLVKIIISNNPDFSIANGEYTKPLADSKVDFDVEFGDKSVDYSFNDGVGIINMSKDNYEMVTELYFDFSATEIPAGVYSLSDTGDDSTALMSDGIENGVPQKSYIAQRDNSGKITDCWLMKEGTITVSYDGCKMIVEVSAYNSNGKSIVTSGTYLYTIGDLLDANSNFPRSYTDSFSADSWLNEKGVKMCYFPSSKLFKFGAMSYYDVDTLGLSRVNGSQYKFEDAGKFIDFNLTEGVLSSVGVSNYSKILNGIFTAHTIHVISETFPK